MNIPGVSVVLCPSPDLAILPACAAGLWLHILMPDTPLGHVLISAEMGIKGKSFSVRACGSLNLGDHKVWKHLGLHLNSGLDFTDAG